VINQQGFLSYLYCFVGCEVISDKQDALLSQRGLCDAAENFGMCWSLQWHRAVFTVIATLSN